MAAERREDGFTLIEMVVALNILAALMAGLAAGVRFAVRAREAQARQDEAMAAPEAVQGLLRRLIDEARAREPQAGEAGGDAASFTVLGRLPAVLGEPRTLPLTLECTGTRLVLRWPGGTAEMLGGLEGCGFAYWLPPAGDGSRDGRPGGWQESWPDPARLPGLIAVRVAFPPGDPRLWAPLTAAPVLAE